MKGPFLIVDSLSDFLFCGAAVEYVSGRAYLREPAGVGLPNAVGHLRRRMPCFGVPQKVAGRADLRVVPEAKAIA